MKHLYTFCLWLATKCRPQVVPNKEAVLAFQHPELIRRLVEKYEMTLEQAEAAFLGMKQYLYLCATVEGSLSPQSESVDESWHNFMLFSQDYAKFCFTHFGHFIHHQPFSVEKRATDKGEGSQNTAKALLSVFGVVQQPMGVSGRCDPCSGGAGGGSCSRVTPHEEGKTSCNDYCCKYDSKVDKMNTLIESNM